MVDQKLNAIVTLYVAKRMGIWCMVRHSRRHRDPFGFQTLSVEAVTLEKKHGRDMLHALRKTFFSGDSMERSGWTSFLLVKLSKPSSKIHAGRKETSIENELLHARPRGTSFTVPVVRGGMKERKNLNEKVQDALERWRKD
ncbi:hypothetical protein FY534_13650 (plasmid) [Alicyclobacillus sp. TC]|nr:hypothetical protein FY534_13650 [Alicyclobacillus sp. TC]